MLRFSHSKLVILQHKECFSQSLPCDWQLTYFKFNLSEKAFAAVQTEAESHSASHIPSLKKFRKEK